MWIDAISINQENEVEKKRQLKMMEAIYRQAGNVVIWLGDTDCPEQETLVRQSMALLQDISRNYRTEYETALDDADAWESSAYRQRATLQLQAARKSWVRRSEFGATFLKNCQESELVAIHDFFTRDYWHRLWIIQELASSQPSAPIFFGESATQRRFVRDASYLLLDIEDLFREMTSSALQRRGAPMRPDYSVRHVTVISDLARLGRLQPEHFQSNVPLPIEHNLGTNPGNVVSQVLRSVLALACGARCKNPEDRIYGLINLPAMPWASMDITVGKSAKEAFIGFAMACIEQDLTLSILSLLDGADGGEYNLPSWCLNLARGPDAAIRPLEGTWSANNNEFGDEYRCLMWGNVSFEDNEPMTLSCMAWVVDTVDGLGAVSPCDQANHTFENGFVSEVVQQSMNTVASTDDSTENIIYETLVAGARIGGQCAHETFKHLLSAFTEKRPPSGSPDIPNWEFIQSSKSLKINGEPFSSFFTFLTEASNATNRLASAEARQTMQACTRNRRLIVTESGRLGLAPVRVQKGDRVIIMHSHTVPLIARPIQEDGDGNVKRMLRGRIIGEAYVSGIMYGEAVEQYREISQYMPAQLRRCYFI